MTPDLNDDDAAELSCLESEIADPKSHAGPWSEGYWNSPAKQERYGELLARRDGEAAASRADSAPPAGKSSSPDRKAEIEAMMSDGSYWAPENADIRDEYSMILRAEEGEFEPGNLETFEARNQALERTMTEETKMVYGGLSDAAQDLVGWVLQNPEAGGAYLEAASPEVRDEIQRLWDGLTESEVNALKAMGI